MPRLFVGIDLPSEIKLKLGSLCVGLPGARWVDPGNFHLTLRFIGEVTDAAVIDIDAALMRIGTSRFMLTLAGVGYFGKRTVWVGVEDAPLLMMLQGDVESALQSAGLAPEVQPFFPHVKLARLRRPGRRFRDFLTENASFRSEPFEVEQFSLIESQLTKKGSIYSYRTDYALT